MISSFVLWAHHCSDPSWSTASYIRILKFSTIDEYWQLVNSLKDELSTLFKTHMIFLMKSYDGIDIYPQWEDSHNKNGGCWSMKTSHSEVFQYFISLSAHLISGQVSCSNNCDNVNGISITPKTSHSIIKVWMKNIGKDKMWYSDTLYSKIPLVKKAVFQIHDNNLKRDHRKKTFFQTNKNRHVNKFRRNKNR